MIEVKWLQIIVDTAALIECAATVKVIHVQRIDALLSWRLTHSIDFSSTATQSQRYLKSMENRPL